MRRKRLVLAALVLGGALLLTACVETDPFRAWANSHPS
jgi:predicted small secreted protein